MEKWLQERIIGIFKDDPLSSMMGIHIVTLSEGSVTMSMPITSEILTNAYGLVHGGSLATMADSVMGVVGLTTGNLVVTSGISINFISNSKKGNILTASGKLIHKENNIIVVEAEIRDKRQALIVKAQGSYFIRRPIKPPLYTKQD